MSKRVFDAIEFAAQAHAGQFRKGTNIPYIVHPLNVAKILIDLDCPEAVVLGGILHDTVEDTPITLDDIVRHFGKRVAYLVRNTSEVDKSQSWENRKLHTIEYLRKRASVDVLLIACADKLDNIRAIREDYGKLGDSLWARFNRPKSAQQWYFQSLARVFRSRIKGKQRSLLARYFQLETQQVFGASSSRAIEPISHQ